MEVNFYQIKQDACSRHFLWKLSRTFSFITYFGCGLVERVGVEKHFLGLGNLFALVWLHFWCTEVGMTSSFLGMFMLKSLSPLLNAEGFPFSILFYFIYVFRKKRVGQRGH